MVALPSGFAAISPDDIDIEEGNVTFSEVDAENVVLPDEFAFTVMGWYSQCEINETVSWIGE